MWNRLSVFRKGLVLIAAPLVLQLAFVVLIADMERSNARAVGWSMHSKDVLRQTQVVLRNLLELGTGLRGFILSADPDLRAAYERAARQLPLDVDELERRVADNPDQSAEVGAIAASIAEFMTWHAETVRLSAAGDREAAIDRARSDTNARLQAAIVEAMTAFIRTEDALDRERTADLEQSRARQRQALWVGAGASLVITLGLAVVFGRSVGGRLAALTGNVRRLARGEELAPPVAGTDEVAQLDRAFRGMAREVAAGVASLRRSADLNRALYEQAERSAAEVGRLNEDLERTVAERTAELAAANDALRDAARRKDQFIAMLAHELRNPLAPIKNGVRLLGLARDEATVGRVRELIGRQVEHLAHIVADLLDASRVARGKVDLRRERVDLGRVVRQVAADEARAFDAAGVRLALDLPDAPVWVDGDRTRLTQVVNNLLANAAKFTDRGGDAAVGLGVADGAAVLRVRDTGVGIAPDLLPRVFDAFTQADESLDRSRGGLGLGLALVKGVVELHGGSVRAASPGRGGGAEFTVTLPTTAEPVAPPADAPPPEAGAKRRLRVLIVEDNRDAADSLRMFLELTGSEVAVAYTGPDGVELARRAAPDLVLCDIGLPGLDGYEVARRIRDEAAGKRPVLVALTGYGEEDDRRRAREAGFDHHFTKPADPAVIERLLGSVA
ncbi:MAG: CHASE3 domain-containing protein [Gemmataceae bacterium]|nr:CHASE3 domain-containing protein [Gemmataceae bacterium]